VPEAEGGALALLSGPDNPTTLALSEDSSVTAMETRMRADGDEDVRLEILRGLWRAVDRFPVPDDATVVGSLLSPMPGTVLDVAVSAGDHVEAGQLPQAVVPGGALHAVNFGTPAPGSGIGGGQALLMEAVLTFFLMFVVYGTAMDGRAPKLAGLFIGLTVTLDIFIGGPITGAAMNPVRWFGPAVAGGGGFGNFWIYLVGPAAGAVAAALLWRYFLEVAPSPRKSEPAAV